MTEKRLRGTEDGRDTDAETNSLSFNRQTDFSARSVHSLYAMNILSVNKITGKEQGELQSGKQELLRYTEHQSFFAIVDIKRISHQYFERHVSHQI